MDFVVVLNQILVLFILLVTGYIAKKLKVFDDKFLKGLSGFLLKVSLPAMIILNMQLEFTLQLLVESGQILGFSLIVYGFSYVGALMLPKIIKAPNNEIGVYQFVIMFSNVGFMGYPVIEAVFGKEATFYTAIYNLPFNFILFTLGIYLLKKGGESKHKITLNTLINPGIIAVFTGFTLFLLSVRLPYIVYRPLEMLGGMTTPLSMIVIGGILANTNIKGMMGNWKIYMASFLRLIAIPIAVFFMLKPFTSNPLMLGVPVVISAMPAAANTAILSQEYGADPQLASQIVSVSTFLSIITIPIIALLVT